MATKTTAMERSDERSAKRQEPGALQEFSGSAMGKWNELTRFLSDVRAEMRKVVAPSTQGSPGDHGRGHRNGVPLWRLFLSDRLLFRPCGHRYAEPS